jgi:Toprim-like/Protein of unknown function (DUF3991)
MLAISLKIVEAQRMSWDDEIEAFKTAIDLREYAASLGYTLDRKESWRGSAVMRSGGDKVVIKRETDGHYVYFSVRKEHDNGSIIDFVQNRKGKHLNMGQVRKELRPWIGRPAVPVPLFPQLEKTGKDRLRVEAEYRRMQDAPAHPYLVQARRLSPALLRSHRFTGRIRGDDNGNAVFPHFDAEGLCGYELKNSRFTGFAKGGEKGLWFSRAFAQDRRLVLSESAIDALSYAALYPDERARYASIGGQTNPKQPDLIKAAALRLAEGSEIIAAMDNDTAGRDLSSLVAAAVEASGRNDISFRVHCPDTEGADWNDVLKASNSFFPTAHLQQPPKAKLGP